MEVKHSDFWKTSGDSSTPDRFGLRRQTGERVEIAFTGTERAVIALAHLLADLPDVVYLNEVELSQPGNMAKWRVKFTVPAVITRAAVARVIAVVQGSEQK